MMRRILDSMQSPARRFLITGATGILGRQLMAALAAAPDIAARVISRRARPVEFTLESDWIRADLIQDEIGASTDGVDAVIHLASTKVSSDADARATQRLLEAARASGVRHFVLISIIGCDRIPLPFYGTKLVLEGLVRESGVAWTIVRVAQFHSFVERMVAAPASLPLPTPYVRDLRFQPVDEREVAEHLLTIARGSALGDAPDFAGPELLTLEAIAETWRRVTGRSPALVPIRVDELFPAPDQRHAPERRILEGYRLALNAPRGRAELGSVRFEEWLERRQAASKPALNAP